MNSFHACDGLNWPFASENDEPLSDQRRVKPPAQCLKLHIPSIGDALDHKANLVHMRRDHDSRRIAGPILARDQRADAVHLDMVGQRLKLPTHDVTDGPLKAAGAVGVRQLF